ncbi:oligosaccharide flippase family protein [Butyrivibrio sp. AC2005]|uniref:oligosaccharide flippase family protein n=1 Tax=Butyrivibrio sp. AC2005 TaxID=1280672 RepID=UPI0004031464|nr:polysaccharide biosynthesis C-terminal domain-containing protein [Butyrivibrio sp. AC2005]
MKENKYKFLAKNTILFTVSSFGSKLLAFIMVPFYTSILTTSEFGVADLLSTSSSLIVFFVTICIADAVLRFAIESYTERQGVFLYGIKVVLSGVSLFGLILSVIAFFNPIKWDLYLYFFLYLLVCFSAFYQLISNYLRAINKIVAVAISGILLSVTTVLFNILFLFMYNMGLKGYLISMTSGYFITLLYGIIVIIKNEKGVLKQKCSHEKGMQMIKYSLPLVFNGVAWWINASLDRYFIIFFHNVALNGLYAVASKIPTILNIVNQIFSQAWNLSAIKEYDKNDKNNFFKNIYSLYNFTLMTSCSILIMFNIPLAKILFAKDFYAAWRCSSILVIATVFSAMSSFLGSIFVAVKNSKIFAVSTVTAAALNSILNLVLIPGYGEVGAAIATVISFAVIWLIRFICVKKYMILKINIARDIISYVLICVQVFFEHTVINSVFLHLILFCMILLLYRKEMCYLLKHLNKRRNKL